VSDTLTDAVVEAARQVPGNALLAGASAVETLAGWSAVAAQRLVGADPSDGYELHATMIAEAWSSVPALAGAAVAAALRAAAGAVTAERDDNRVSLVWTGPPTEELALRSTRAVLGRLVERATTSLLLVSYAGFDVDDLAAGLLAAALRGVEVTLVLETKADNPKAGEAALAFKTLAGHASFYRWPAEKRSAAFAPTAALHAKCAVRDACEVLITSANLTSAAINDNMELGVLIERGPLPAKLSRHFALLIETDVLERIGP
jgi:cardiolipin synthase